MSLRENCFIFPNSGGCKMFAPAGILQLFYGVEGDWKITLPLLMKGK